ncbi:MAG TPA: tripartite tricarboxylate transporter TctB family protein [Burkholderiales bacterium]|nr:tripartite tricarboxylate transporter TctB family protein [Burkholderiales bacterium]
MRPSDVVPALLMLALSAAIAVDTRALSFWADTTPGPAFLPVWLAIAGAVLFVLRLAEARRGGGGPPVQWPERAAVARVALVFAALVAVPLVSPVVGLAPALALLVAFVLLFVLRQRLWPSLAAVGITLGLIYAVFVGWLGVPLPKGPLGL